MDAVTILMDISFVLATVLGVCYLYQLAYLFIPFLIRKKPHKKAVRHKYAILIAARNEETVLPYLLDSITMQDYPSELYRTYVVADNCTDNTAKVARQHGATVFERFNQKEIGKGYALNFLLKKIEEEGTYEGYDAFLIFDADNLLCPNYITAINRTYSDGYEVFCGYRNSKNFADNWVSSGYAIWYMHDSAHLNQSRMLLGTSCAVSGTGFGLSRRVLEMCGGWNFFTLTEDIEFDTWCAVHDVKIGYNADAMLYDEQPSSFRQSWRQRTRWIQGGVQIAFKYGGSLFKSILRPCGKNRYACFETATMSFWAFVFSAFAMILSLVTTFLSKGWLGILLALLSSLAGVYVSMFFCGLLVVLTEWNKIAGTSAQKIGYLFTFPFFMFTFVPIALTAIFRKPQWKPIRHSVAISVSQITNTETQD